MDAKNIENSSFGSMSSAEAQKMGFNVLFQEEDGTYDWIYSLNMLKNRSMLIYVIRVIIIIWIVIALIFVVLAGGSDKLLLILGILALCLVGAILIAFFAVWLVNKLYKGSYLLVYQMNDEQLVFSQTTDQAQITRTIAAASAAINAAGNNIGGAIAGAGLALGPNAYRSRFSKVRSVKGKRKDNLIEVNTFLQNQMVYVPEEYYDFVWEYITQRCRKARIREG